MRLRVMVPGHLREYVSAGAYEGTGGRSDDFIYAAGGPLTLADLLRAIGLRPELAIGALFEGRRIGREDLLDGDGEVVILSPIAGGGSA
ncbi:MAG TPA: hypothetical protein VGL40_02285 [Bacillota bacterium]